MGTRRRRETRGWTAVNLDTTPDNFEFKVVPQFVLTLPEPTTNEGSLTIDETLYACTVFFHARRTRTVPPLQDKLIEIVSPPQVSSQEACSQLCFALRLFKPEPFWVISDSERTFGILVQPEFSSLPQYNLRDQELTHFRLFSEHLLEFQREVRMMKARRLFSAMDMTLMPQDEQPVRSQHLALAGELFRRVFDVYSAREGYDVPYLTVITALEALLTEDEKSEVSHRIAQRLAFLIGVSPTHRKTIFSQMRENYNVRSRLVHGSLIKGKWQVVSVSWQRFLEATNHLRTALLYFIALDQQGWDRRRILEALDKTAFDESEIVAIRLTANRHWGFGESTDEQLFAPKWTSRLALSHPGAGTRGR